MGVLQLLPSCQFGVGTNLFSVSDGLKHDGNSGNCNCAGMNLLETVIIRFEHGASPKKKTSVEKTGGNRFLVAGLNVSRISRLVAVCFEGGWGFWGGAFSEEAEGTRARRSRDVFAQLKPLFSFPYIPSANFPAFRRKKKKAAGSHRPQSDGDVERAWS